MDICCSVRATKGVFGGPGGPLSRVGRRGRGGESERGGSGRGGRGWTGYCRRPAGPRVTPSTLLMTSCVCALATDEDVLSRDACHRVEQT
jgi:hypothetical protein